MKISKIMEKLAINDFKNDGEINRVVTNSNDIKSGDIFLAIKGNLYNGNDYIDKVIEKGCKCIFSEQISNNFTIKTDNILEIKDKLIELLYKDIYEKCFFIGVTGTNGKTTTTHIIYEVLKKYVDSPIILVGTNGIYFNNHKTEIENTTPDELVIFNFIKENINDNEKVYIVMEVSSHALSLNRLNHITFDIAVFLNLSHEHLDYYNNMTNYANAKALLFNKVKESGTAIINLDDQYAYKMINLANKNIFFGKKYRLNQFIINKSDLKELIFNYNGENYKLPIIGNYNAYNACAAINVLKILNISTDDIKEGLENLKQISGRMELHIYNNKNIIIDFAHTPLAMKNVLTFVRSLTCNKIVTLFGCGGNRDKDKRPKMMEVASLYSDEVYLTSDNPRFEDPLDIIKDTLIGMKNDQVHLFIDRRLAIRNAVKNLNKDEYLLILGKGHENFQIVLDKKIRFNDLEEVEKWI